MHTAVWSVLHFLVDMVCAWAMYAYFGAGNYENLLIYNFCAFALQLPFGTFLDLCRGKYCRFPVMIAVTGVAATLCGAALFLEGKTVRKGPISFMQVKDFPAIVAHALGIPADPNWMSHIPEGLFAE